MKPPVLQFAPDQDGVQVSLQDLVASRLLIQGSSGAGKSYLARYMLEQTHGQIQQIIFDPEGEFATLRERFDYVVASADGDGDVAADPKSAKLLCRQLVELGASAILDIYELDPEDREEFVARFLRELLSLPKDLWRPALVVIDEAHEFAPEAGNPVSRKPVELLVSKGRKRGLGAICLTQRLSKLSKNASDLQNYLIGYTGLDTDVRRAGDILGFDKAQQQGLKLLETGEFYAFGPAITREVTKVRSGPIQTHHPVGGEVRPPTPPPRGKLRALLSKISDIPERAAEEERSVAALEEKVSRLQRELRAEKRASSKPAASDPEAIERRVAAERNRIRSEVEKQLASYQARVEGQFNRAGKLVQDLADVLVAPAAPELTNGGQATTTRRIPTPRRTTAVVAEPSGDVSVPQQRILDTLSLLEGMGIVAPDRSTVGMFADQSPRSSGYANNLGRLRSLGLIDYPSGGKLQLTSAGSGLAKPPDDVATLDQLHDAWFTRLSHPQVRILQALIAAFPSDLSREELAEISEQSPTSSGYANNLGFLRNSLGLIDYPAGGRVVATTLLFPAGLM